MYKLHYCEILNMRRSKRKLRHEESDQTFDGSWSYSQEPVTPGKFWYEQSAAGLHVLIGGSGSASVQPACTVLLRVASSRRYDRSY